MRTSPKFVPETEPAMPWWKGAVIYQIYPRSFADSNGDGIGDLPGITQRLDHVASLGVDAIWLSPFFKSPMRDFGYDVADYRAVDPIFGTLNDFDALVARAHALGLRVIIDQVYAHTSDEHDWFVESRADRTNGKADWYVWADPKPDGSPPNNWQSVFGGPAWTWDGRRRQYYLHNFLREQPQLNGHNPDVQQALLDTARFWLDRGVDGFRVDAINFAMHEPALTDNPPAPDTGKVRTRSFDYQLKKHNQGHRDIPRFIERVRALTDSYGDRFTVAEVGGDEALREMREFTAPGRFNTAYGFDYLYADALTPALVARTIENWPTQEGWPSWAFSNHDAPRSVTRWAGEAEREAAARMQLLLLMSLRGNVFLYQGEELGLPQAQVPFEHLQDPEAIANWPLTLGRDGARTPMPWAAKDVHAGFSTVSPWLPMTDPHAALSVDAQEGDAGSILALTRRLVAMRAASPALRTGRIRVEEAGERLLVFEREEGGDRRLCAFNLSGEPLDWALPEGWRIDEAVNGATATRLPGWGGVVARS